MTDRKLVTVITPTWNRHELLSACIENVRAQTYRPIEHIVVSDGPDDLVNWKVERTLYAEGMHDPERRIPIKVVELGFNTSTVLPDSFAAAPNFVGSLLAKGEYHCPWPDDDRAEPEHLEKLINLLEETGADFAYPRVEMHWWYRAENHWTIGADPPACGQITHYVYRASLLARGLYPFGAGGISDWAQINTWMQAGATWAYLPEVTFHHRADH